MGVYLVDSDLRFIAVNPAAAKAFEGAQNLIGSDFGETMRLLNSDEYVDEILSRFRHTLSTGESYFVPEQIRETPGRGRKVFDWQINRIVLPDGRYGVVCYSRDITKQVEAREGENRMAAAAIAANAKFRAVFEQSNVLAGIMTLDGVLVEANRACLEGCGYRAEEVLNQPFWSTPWWREFPESQVKVRRAAAQAAKGTPFRETLSYSFADGTERLMEFALYPIVDDSGSIIYLHPTGMDITDLKRAEENYRALAESLETEVRARTRELQGQNAEVLRQSEMVRDFSQRLLLAQDEERRRIARELHDSAGQTLTVLSMNLARLAEDARALSPQLANEVEETEKVVQQLHQGIRTTSYLLHPPLLDESGLASALNWYVEGLKDRSNLQVRLKISEDFGRIPREMELTVFRLVQESLTNIHRHAAAKVAYISLERKKEAISVSVEDDGKGMTQEKLREVQFGGYGVGLRGLRERVRQFQGEMQIQSNTSGTKISVNIPVPAPAESEKLGPLPAAV